MTEVEMFWNTLRKIFFQIGSVENITNLICLSLRYKKFVVENAIL